MTNPTHPRSIAALEELIDEALAEADDAELRGDMATFDKHNTRAMNLSATLAAFKQRLQ